MSNSVSEHMRVVLARSLPMVRQHKDEIISQMEVQLQDVEVEGEPFGQSEVAAMMLTELLIDEASRIVQSGRPGNLDEAARELWSLGVDGRHYSRFGDMLVPVLRDALASGIPHDVTSAWSDTFWLVIREAQERQALAYA